MYWMGGDFHKKHLSCDLGLWLYLEKQNKTWKQNKTDYGKLKGDSLFLGCLYVCTLETVEEKWKQSMNPEQYSQRLKYGLT